MRGWAEFSPCGQYRFLLGREWDPALPRFSFGLLNPSKAGADAWDPTARKVLGFTQRLGGGSFEIWNPFPLIATDPADLKARLRNDEDAIGYKYSNRGILLANAHIVESVERCTGKVIVGWGAHAADPFIRGRVGRILRLLDGVPLYCLGRTSAGFPRHPLMLPYSTPPERFEVQS